MKLATRRLGQSDLEITRVGIGTAPIGSTPSWDIYWGPQNESEAIRAIEAALELGVNWIDTAPFYGWGRAEQIVGKALRGKRDSVYIFTKCGTLRNEQGGWREDLSPASIRREVEASLRNFLSHEAWGGGRLHRWLCGPDIAAQYLMNTRTAACPSHR